MVSQFALESEPADERGGFESAIDSVLSEFGAHRAGKPVPVEGSVSNENFRVASDAGDLLVRFHKDTRERPRLELEHRMARHAEARGIPVILPLAKADGRALLRVRKRWVSVFPWGDGLRHARPTEADAAAMGEMQGRMHRVLRTLDDPGLARGGTGTAWDTERSIASFSRVDDLIRYYPAPGEWQLMVQGQLRTQLAYLESGRALAASAFDWLPVQACHGDYHDRNVLFGEDGAVGAVVDWEMAGLLCPAFEVVRATVFGGMSGPALLGTYMEGYRRESHLDADVARGAVEQFWQLLMHDSWVFEMRFIRGERRVERFFEGRETMLGEFGDEGYRERLAEAIAG